MIHRSFNVLLLFIGMGDVARSYSEYDLGEVGNIMTLEFCCCTKPHITIPRSRSERMIINFEIYCKRKFEFLPPLPASATASDRQFCLGAEPDEK